MVWKTRISSTSSPDPTITIETDAIEKDTIVDGLQAMVLRCSYDNATEDETLLIRTEGYKVYFRKMGETDKEWYLLYDFGMHVGEGSYIYTPNRYGEPFKMYIKCIETKDVDADYYGLSTLLVEEYETDACTTPYGRGIWIKGLSAAQGLLFSNGFDLDGIGTSLLLEVTDCGNVLYSGSANSIEKVTDQPVIRIDGLYVHVSKLQKGSTIALYSAEGQTLESRCATGGEAHLALPKSGIYLLKVGELTRKILAQ